MWWRRVLSRDESDRNHLKPLLPSHFEPREWIPSIRVLVSNRNNRSYFEKSGWSGGQVKATRPNTTTEWTNQTGGNSTLHRFFWSIPNLSDLYSDNASCACVFYFELTCLLPPNYGSDLMKAAITGRSCREIVLPKG